MLKSLRFPMALFVVLSALQFSTAAFSAEAKLPGLSAVVHVEVDGYGIPHIYAESWPDAARVIGYLHASDRLWQMDLLRRQASGTTAEILGEQGLASDVMMRQLGIRRACEQMWKHGDLPADFRAELEAYSAGVNTCISKLRSEKSLPPMFAGLDYEPAPWTPIDSLVFSKYMGWDQAGTDDDLWFGIMVEKLGIAAVEELWPLERPYEQPTVPQQAPPAAVKELTGGPAIHGAGEVYAKVQRRLARVKLLGRGPSFGSNNWAVDGTKTASGKPILCNDPHLGFSLPSLWYTAHISVRGENTAGVTFPGSPVCVLGQNDHISWGVTNMQSDTVDYFVETVDPDNPLRYRHRGEWKTMEHTVEQVAVRGRSPHMLSIDTTVHGPIINREGKVISLQWTGLKPTKDALSFWKLSHARNFADFLAAADDLTVPALNLVYADDAGNIAIHPCGEHPLRLRGQGRIPMDGASGENDWMAFVPRRELPLSLNPEQHFVASANARPMPLGYPHYLGWMWDPSYRMRRINEMLSRAQGLTVESMRAVQLDAYDKAAERFVPVLLDVVSPASAENELAQRALKQLAAWDYVADVDALGPAIWMRWFDHYRRAVWDDEWSARGIEQPAGSWGFTGDNRREPMLEVLEYMTREYPDAIWFDDRKTPQRETRNDLIRSSFASAVASLVEEFGNNPDHWTWGRFNKLRVGSLAGQEELARDGGPVVGTIFTVNPGGDLGPVGSGASWRQIVDLAQPSRSVGVYPGGQSESPASPHYDDQMKLWARGEYLPLNMVGRDELPKSARVTAQVFVP